MNASEVNTVHLPASARSKKRKGRLATFDRHAKYFRSLCGRLTGVEDHDNVNSRCSKIYDNTTFSLDSDESVGLMVQHPPKKQVTTKMDKKGKTVTLVTCYTVSPEERIEPEYYCLADILGKYAQSDFAVEVWTPAPCEGHWTMWRASWENSCLV